MRLPLRHTGETPKLVLGVRTRTRADGMVGVAGLLQWQLCEGRAVEHVDDVHAHGLERAVEVTSRDHRSEVIGGRAGCQQRQEWILDREVAGISGGVELWVYEHLSRPWLDPETFVGWKPLVPDGGCKRRKRHQQVECRGALPSPPSSAASRGPSKRLDGSSSTRPTRNTRWPSCTRAPHNRP
jgi:hypothetical protein